MELDNGDFRDVDQALLLKPLSLSPAPVWQVSCSATRCPAALALGYGAPGGPGRNAVFLVGEESSYDPGNVPDLPALDWLIRPEFATSMSAEVNPAILYPNDPLALSPVRPEHDSECLYNPLSVPYHSLPLLVMNK